VLVAFQPPAVLFGGFAIYALSGPLLTVLSKRRALASRQGETHS
jgi:hypothetical protein